MRSASSSRIEFSERETAFIYGAVKDGVYADVTKAAVHDGLRLLDRERSSQAATLRSEVKKGFDDLNVGRYVEINSDDELDARMDNLSARAAEREPEVRRELNVADPTTAPDHHGGDIPDYARLTYARLSPRLSCRARPRPRGRGRRARRRGTAACHRSDR